MSVRSTAALLVTLAVAVSAALADDAPSDRPIQTHRQLMKRCMAEQKAKNNGGSEDEMKKFCEEQIKSYRDHPSSPTPESAPHS